VHAISFDLLYAAVDIAHINSQNDIEKLIFNEAAFDRLEKLSQKSFNGYLCNANIQKNVPNFGVFRNFLRIIKLWAKRRCIYSAMFGYLTGISCAVMVAKIHQDNPDLDVVDLVYKFFEVYSESDWTTPVSIKFGKMENMSLTSWKNALDNVEGDLMAILSPNYELRNTTQRVQGPTFDTLIYEFRRAKDIMK
jgi:poly(A) polymerase